MFSKVLASEELTKAGKKKTNSTLIEKKKRLEMHAIRRLMARKENVPCIVNLQSKAA